MIDAWLIFNLIIPFVLIMIHTFMDTLRVYVETNLSITRTLIRANSVHSLK